MSKKRTTIYLDEEKYNFVKAQDINLSKKVNEMIKNDFSSVEQLEKKKKEIESKVDRKITKKQSLEREIHELKRKKERLRDLLIKNDVMRQIRSNDRWKSKFSGAVTRVQRADDEEVAVKKNVDILVEKNDFPFSRSKLEKALRSFVGVEDEL